MTADRLAGELGESASGPGGEGPAGLPLATILAMCDQALGEIGRRKHMFSWLRAPEGGAEGWLPVDAYYPGNRLVVIYRPRPGPHDDLQRELVPAHGLRLLVLTPRQLGADPERARDVLRQMLADLGPPRQAVEDPPAPAWRLRLPRTAPGPRGEPTARTEAAPSTGGTLGSRRGPAARAGYAEPEAGAGSGEPLAKAGYAAPPAQALPPPGPRSAAVERATRFVESRRTAARAIAAARDGEPEDWWFGSPSREALVVVGLVIAVVVLIVLFAQLLGV